MLVTFWHELCLTNNYLTNLIIMKSLTKQYETAKNRANLFMTKGEIPQYFEALLEMNRYKRLMKAIVAN